MHCVHVRKIELSEPNLFLWAKHLDGQLMTLIKPDSVVIGGGDRGLAADPRAFPRQSTCLHGSVAVPRGVAAPTTDPGTLRRDWLDR